MKGNHSATCGCMTAAFIAKAHTNFSSILMEAKSQEEFVRRLTALPNHARDVLYMYTSGREDSAISTHCEFARARLARTNGI